MLSFCTISPLSDFCELCEFVSILIRERDSSAVFSVVLRFMLRIYLGCIHFTEEDCLSAG